MTAPHVEATRARAWDVTELLDAGTRTASVRAKPPWPGDEIEQRAQEGWRRGGKRGPKPILCRLCGRGNLPTRRHSWHPRCAAVIQPAIFRYSAFRWLLRRQRGTCATCPQVLGERRVSKPDSWEASRYGSDYWHPFSKAVEIDHRIPLWRVALMPPERRTIRWWLAGNLQALCVRCHRAKTTREAAERAGVRSPQRALFPIAEARS